MDHTNAGSIRIGPVSILSLMIILCLAVLAVLAVSTAHASYALTERQADTTQDLYANENEAEAFVAELDAALVPMRAAQSPAPDAAATIAGELTDLLHAAHAKTLDAVSHGAGESDVKATAAIDGTTIEADFLCDDYQNLSVTIDLLDGGRYQVTSWLANTVWPERGQTETLLVIDE